MPDLCSHTEGKRNKLDRVSFRGIFVRCQSSTQVKVFNPATGKVSQHTAVKFRKDVPGGTLLENSGRSNRHEAEIISIFGNKDSEGKDENQENQENANVRDAEGQAPSESTELVGTGSASPTKDKNHEKRVDHVTPANQTAKKFAQPTRRSTRINKPYDPYQYDNEYGLAAITKSDFSINQQFEPSTYEEATNCPDQRLWKLAITEQLNALIANQTWEITNDWNLYHRAVCHGAFLSCTQ